MFNSSFADLPRSRLFSWIVPGSVLGVALAGVLGCSSSPSAPSGETTEDAAPGDAGSRADSSSVDAGSHADSSAVDGSSHTDSSSVDATSHADSSVDASPDGSAACGCNGKSGCAVWKDVFVTWYGFNDNSCTVESQHDCNTIAFPGLGPQKHAVATEGTGTYDDPITCAASASNDGGDSESAGGATLTPGTIVYNPEVKKYFIMEDQCAECTSDDLCEPDDDTSPSTKAPTGCKQSQYLHIDFWMGPSFMQNATNLNDCEDNSTIGNPYGGTGTVVVNPPDNLEVVTTPLYTGGDAGGGCWTRTQVPSDSCP